MFSLAASSIPTEKCTDVDGECSIPVQGNTMMQVKTTAFQSPTNVNEDGLNIDEIAMVDTETERDVPKSILHLPGSLDRITKALRTAAEQFESGGGSHGGAADALQAIENAVDNFDDIIKEHHDAISKALDEVAVGEDFDTAEKNGELISAEDLADLDEQSKLPEEQSTEKNTVEMDMVAEDEEQYELLLQYAREGRKWLPRPMKNPGQIGTCYHSNTPENAREGWRTAIQEIQEKISCLAFVDKGEVSSEWNLHSGKPGGEDKKGCDLMMTAHAGGCWAGVGARIWPPTPVHIGDGCQHHGIVVHEILHGLGILHEHSRPDRDQWINIHWEDIAEWGAFAWKEGDRDQFDVTHEFDVPYDVQSIMHYCARSTSGTGNPVFTETDYAIKNHPGPFTPGQRNSLTPRDVKQLELFYCTAKPEPPPPPPPPAPRPSSSGGSLKVKVKSATKPCPKGFTLITNADDCKTAAKQLKKKYNGAGIRPKPAGCYIDPKKSSVVGLNTGPQKNTKSKHSNICAKR